MPTSPEPEGTEPDPVLVLFLSENQRLALVEGLTLLQEDDPDDHVVNELLEGLTDVD